MNVNKRNNASGEHYVNGLHDTHAKLQVIRLDLSYRKEYANTTTVADAKRDMQHLLNNRRSKPTLFRHCVGHIWDLEQGEEKGPHFHTAFFFDGSQVEHDAYLGAKIGEYWNEQITGGRGISFNCNAKKSQYEYCGIGAIHYADEEKRNNLLKEVLPYLTKTDQSIDDVKSGNERCFGRGIMPKKKSNAGRPREYE